MAQSLAAYSLLVTGNNLRLRDDFLGISTVALVEAGGRRILFDVGGPISRMGLLKALGARGLTPGDIDLVFLSHLHFDHCYNLDLFAEAAVMVSSVERAYAAAPHAEDLFIPDWILERLDKRHVEEIGESGALAPGVEILAAPGHTPGLRALRLETNAGVAVLASDAVKYPKEVMTRRCDLAFDRIETGAASIERILDMADRLAPGHFPEMTRGAHGWSWDDAAEFALLVR